MAKITAGLKQLSQSENLPEGDYRLKIVKVRETNDKTGEYASCTVIKGPPDTKGKNTMCYLLNKVTEQAIGLAQVLKSLQLMEVPDGPYGKSETRNLEGLEFNATISIGEDKKTKQDRNFVNPSYDVDWWNKQLATDDAPKGRKKSTKKR